jgi:CheY-like chemotaxis protein
MGGDISASSEPGRGSVFTLSLPLEVLDARQPAGQAGDPAPAAPQAEPRAMASASAGQAVDGSLQVLVCDDHPVNRKLMVALLGRLGLAAQTCDHGAQALDLVRSRDWDLVFMDMHMPVMDGLAATRAIRALGPRAASLVVVAVTADAFDEARRLALSAGMNDVITKPLQLRDVQACLVRHLRHLPNFPAGVAHTTVSPADGG